MSKVFSCGSVAEDTVLGLIAVYFGLGMPVPFADGEAEVSSKITVDSLPVFTKK